MVNTSWLSSLGTVALNFGTIKAFFSIVLLALVDYDYQFIFADVGCQGRISDGGVYRHCYFYKALESNQLNLPEDACLPKSTDTAFIDQPYEPLPFVFLGDDAFPLGEHCMKPYGQVNLTPRKRIFNYRLSRMRKVAENAFGILANRFRVFFDKINLDPNKASLVTFAALILHKMLRQKSRESYTPENFVDNLSADNGVVTEGTWRDQSSIEDSFLGLESCRGNRASRNAGNIREVFADHFWGPGQVTWQ